MQKHLVSYWRTIGALLAVAAVVAPIGFWLAKSVDFLGFHALAMLGRVVVNVISAGLFVLLSCALIVLIRARRASSNCSDLFLALNARRMHFAPDAASSRNRLPLRSLRRALGAPRYIVGDRVRIKSLQQVAATLDAGGALDSLPFMPEMARYCGQEASVFRCVDKVYDYGGRKDLRRIRNVVLLYGLRCDGASHDRCQAGCYLLWKNAWLEPVATRAESNLSTHTPDDSARLEAQPVLLAASAVTATGVAPVYRCQYTQLVAASEPMSTRDPRQDLRPLREGNVTLAAFVVAVATRIFNALQGMRGGIGFPWVPASATNQSMHAELHLAPGDIVEVRTAREIADTLTRMGKNRGLWFDRDMLKHSGHRFTVKTRVTRLIDDASGRMLEMKWPCIVLKGIDGSGEYLRFSAQHDEVFWREVWLRRVDPTPATTGDVNSG